MWVVPALCWELFGNATGCIRSPILWHPICLPLSWDSTTTPKICYILVTTCYIDILFIPCWFSSGFTRLCCSNHLTYSLFVLIHLLWRIPVLSSSRIPPLRSEVQLGATMKATAWLGRRVSALCTKPMVWLSSSLLTTPHFMKSNHTTMEAPSWSAMSMAWKVVALFILHNGLEHNAFCCPQSRKQFGFCSVIILSESHALSNSDVRDVTGPATCLQCFCMYWQTIADPMAFCCLICITRAKRFARSLFMCCL